MLSLLVSLFHSNFELMTAGPVWQLYWAIFPQHLYWSSPCESCAFTRTKKKTRKFHLALIVMCHLPELSSFHTTIQVWNGVNVCLVGFRQVQVKIQHPHCNKPQSTLCKGRKSAQGHSVLKYSRCYLMISPTSWMQRVVLDFNHLEDQRDNSFSTFPDETLEAQC